MPKKRKSMRLVPRPKMPELAARFKYSLCALL